MLWASVAPKLPPMKNTATTYDYDTQQWVSGAAAISLRRSQLEQSLAAFTGPRGAEYARFNGLTKIEAANAVAQIRDELSNLT